MPSQPLPRFLETEATRREHARKLEKVVRDAGGDVRELKASHTAVDAEALRGLPAVGRGVAGAVRGTNPEYALLAKEPRG